MADSQLGGKKTLIVLLCVIAAILSFWGLLEFTEGGTIDHSNDPIERAFRKIEKESQAREREIRGN